MNEKIFKQIVMRTICFFKGHRRELWLWDNSGDKRWVSYCSRCDWCYKKTPQGIEYWYKKKNIGTNS